MTQSALQHTAPSRGATVRGERMEGEREEYDAVYRGGVRGARENGIGETEERDEMNRIGG